MPLSLFCVCFFNIYLPLVLPPHDFHTSLAEVHYNPKTKYLEISLRVFTDDLEKAIGQQNQLENFYLDKSERHNPLVEKYIRRTFYLLNAKNEPEPLTFVGKELEADVTWIYFEIPVRKSLKGFQLFNAVLTEVFDDQVNMVNFFYNQQRKTFLFNHRQHRHLLPFS